MQQGLQQGQPKMEDAMDYLEQVKKRYTDNPKAYAAFLHIMKDFKGDKMDTDGFIRAIKTLFSGQRDLIVGFNFFLPPEIKIPEDPEPETPQQVETAVPKLAHNAEPKSELLEPKDSQSLKPIKTQEPLSQQETSLPIQSEPDVVTPAPAPAPELIPVPAPVPAPAPTSVPVSTTDPILANVPSVVITETQKYMDDVRAATTDEQFTKFQEIWSQNDSTSRQGLLQRMETLFKDRKDLIQRFKDILSKLNSSVSESKIIQRKVRSRHTFRTSQKSKPKSTSPQQCKEKKSNESQETDGPQEGQLCIIRLRSAKGGEWPWCVARLRKKKRDTLPDKDNVWSVWWYGNDKGELLHTHVPWWRNNSNKAIYSARNPKGFKPIEDDVEQGTLVWWGFKLTSKNKVPAEVLDIISKNPKVQWSRKPGKMPRSSPGKTRKATPMKSKRSPKKRRKSKK